MPVIQTKVPIVGFYWAAPAILPGPYAYLHLCLQSLWTALARLPAVLPDGTPLDEKAYPWMATSLIRAHVPRLRDDRPAYSRVSVLFTIICAWCFVPVTILVFWGRYLPRHDLVGTMWLLILVTVAVWWGRDSFFLARKKLRGEVRRASAEAGRTRMRYLERAWRLSWRVLEPTLCSGIVLLIAGAISWHAIWEALQHFAPRSLPVFGLIFYRRAYPASDYAVHLERIKLGLPSGVGSALIGNRIEEGWRREVAQDFLGIDPNGKER